MKRFGRKTVVLCLLLGIFVAAVTGCKGTVATDTTKAEDETANTATDGTTAQTSQNSDSELVTFRYEWWGGSKTHEAYTNLQAKYKELQPNVTIEPEYSAFDGYQEKVVTQLAGGTVADLFHIDAPWMQEWVGRGDYFVDLYQQDILDYSTIEQELLDQYCVFDGKLLAIPMGVQCSGLLVNTVAAEKYGITIDKQLTWEEILVLGEQVHTQDPDAYFFTADRGNVLNALINMLKQRSGDQLINDDFTIAFSKEDLLYAYNILQKGYETGVFEPLGDADLYYGSSTPNPKWINGQSVAQLCWNSEFTKVDDLLEGKDEGAMMLWPTVGEGAKQGSSRIRPTYLVGLSTTSKNQEAALAYLDWQVNDKESAKILGSVRAVPTTKAQQEAAVSAGVLRQPVIDALEEGYDNVQASDNKPSQDSELNDALLDEYSKVAYGMATPEEAVETTFQVLEEVLERISQK